MDDHVIIYTNNIKPLWSVCRGSSAVCRDPSTVNRIA